MFLKQVVLMQVYFFSIESWWIIDVVVLLSVLKGGIGVLGVLFFLGLFKGIR